MHDADDVSSSGHTGRSKRAAIALVLAAAAVGEAAWAWTAHRARSEQAAPLAELDDEARAALAAKWDRFAALPETERLRLRELHAAVEADADPESLRRTLGEYQQWVSALPASTSAQLVGLGPAEKAEKVGQIVSEQVRAADQQLSDADSKVLVAWLEKLIATRQDELTADLPQPMRERLDQMGSRERVWAVMLFALTQRGGGPRLDNIRPDEAAELKARLSPQAQAQWSAARGPDGLKQLLVGWIRQSMERAATSGQAGFMATRVSDAELKKFFDTTLTEDERTQLLALPREEMTLQLRREYFRRQGLWRDGFGRSGGPPRSDGGTRPDGGFGGFGPGRPFSNRPGGGYGGPRPPGENPRPPNDAEKGKPRTVRPPPNDPT